MIPIYAGFDPREEAGTRKRGPYKRRPVTERFWEKVLVGDADQCWEWTGAKALGYGRFNTGGGAGVIDGAHRISYAMTYGGIPENMHVLHKCDNRACVNPLHLFLGSNDDNIADKVAKGRQDRGATSSLSKLTEAHVKIIRYVGNAVSAKRFAAEFDVTACTIREIRRGVKSWKHVKVAQ